MYRTVARFYEQKPLPCLFPFPLNGENGTTLIRALYYAHLNIIVLTATRVF